MIDALLAPIAAQHASSEKPPAAGGFSAADLFALADQASAAGDQARVIAIYHALAKDSRVEIRSEARFRLGRYLVSQSRLAEAATIFRALLDEQPRAARVRIELAEVMAALGDEASARRELRLAQAGALPPAVAAVVEQVATGLRARKPLGGTIALAIAPDSNINRATRVHTVDSIIAPLTLSDDARATSGVGLAASGQAYYRIHVASQLAIVPRVSGQANLYRRSQFNDIAAALSTDLSWDLTHDRVVGQFQIRPSSLAATNNISLANTATVIRYKPTKNQNVRGLSALVKSTARAFILPVVKARQSCLLPNATMQNPPIHTHHATKRSASCKARAPWALLPHRRPA